MYGSQVPYSNAVADYNIEILEDEETLPIDICKRYTTWFTGLIIEKLRINHPKFKIGTPNIHIPGSFTYIQQNLTDFCLWFN